MGHIGYRDRTPGKKQQSGHESWMKLWKKFAQITAQTEILITEKIMDHTHQKNKTQDWFIPSIIPFIDWGWRQISIFENPVLWYLNKLSQIRNLRNKNYIPQR